MACNEKSLICSPWFCQVWLHAKSMNKMPTCKYNVHVCFARSDVHIYTHMHTQKTYKCMHASMHAFAHSHKTHRYTHSRTHANAWCVRTHMYILWVYQNCVRNFQTVIQNTKSGLATLNGNEKKGILTIVLKYWYTRLLKGEVELEVVIWRRLVVI